MVNERCSNVGWRWEWTRTFRRGLVKDQLNDLVTFLGEFRCGVEQDAWNWALDSDGVFSVSSTRKWIDFKVLDSNNVVTRWGNLIPMKVNIFVWRLLLNRLPTRMAIAGKGISISNTCCPICGLFEEDVEHLFFLCEVAIKMWELIFKWLDVQCGNFRNHIELFHKLDSMKMPAIKKQVLQVVGCTSLWFLWKYRNDVVHDSKKIQKSMIIDGIQEFSFRWFSTRQKKVKVNWGDWIHNPMMYL